MNRQKQLRAKIEKAKKALTNLPPGPERSLWVRLHNKYVIALRSSAGAKLKVEKHEQK